MSSINAADATPLDPLPGLHFRRVSERRYALNGNLCVAYASQERGGFAEDPLVDELGVFFGTADHRCDGEPS